MYIFGVSENEGKQMRQNMFTSKCRGRLSDTLENQLQQLFRGSSIRTDGNCSWGVGVLGHLKTLQHDTPR